MTSEKKLNKGRNSLKKSHFTTLRTHLFQIFTKKRDNFWDDFQTTVRQDFLLQIHFLGSKGSQKLNGTSWFWHIIKTFVRFLSHFFHSIHVFAQTARYRRMIIEMDRVGRGKRNFSFDIKNTYLIFFRNDFKTSFRRQWKNVGYHVQTS